MAPIILGVGADSSGAGKTTLICRLLRRLDGWGAIKCTPSRLYASVADDPETLNHPGKDTALMAQAGAAEVLWVSATPDAMAETVKMAAGRLSHLRGVVVEGNSAIEVLGPDVIIFIASGLDGGRHKPSAARVLGMADVVVYRKGAEPAGAGGAVRLLMSDDEALIDRIVEVIDGRRA